MVAFELRWGGLCELSRCRDSVRGVEGFCTLAPQGGRGSRFSTKILRTQCRRSNCNLASAWKKVCPCGGHLPVQEMGGKT